MPDYLESVGDGLGMRDSGPWVESKLDYLRRYINAFETAMRDKWARRNFIDLFAGPGKCRVENGTVFLGSPLLSVTTKYPFTGYYFVDLDPNYLEALRIRSSASPVVSAIQFIQDDSNRAVHQIIAEINNADRAARGSSLNLAFLDPEGLELEWGTIESLASVKKMDLIIHYPVMGLKRMIQLASQRENHQIDLFYGDREWRAIYEKAQDASVVERELLDHYKRKLEGLGYVDVRQADNLVGDPAMKNTRQGLLYRLLFASKDRLGDKLWKEVTKRDVHGQRRLF